MRIVHLFQASDSSTDSVSVGDQQLEHRGDGVFAVPAHLVELVRSTLRWLLTEIGIEGGEAAASAPASDDETSDESEDPAEAPGESAGPTPTRRGK